VRLMLHARSWSSATAQTSTTADDGTAARVVAAC
jgi:hypothetical protein